MLDMAELEFRHATMTMAEAVLQQLCVQRMKDIDNGGTTFEGMKENMEELDRDVWSILLDKCEGEVCMEIKSSRD